LRLVGGVFKAKGNRAGGTPALRSQNRRADFAAVESRVLLAVALDEFF
jgi:hypothetical protein